MRATLHKFRSHTSVYIFLIYTDRHTNALDILLRILKNTISLRRLHR
nr:MAG TPA: hypothetical protein [Caudoviricetes sp.]